MRLSAAPIYGLNSLLRAFAPDAEAEQLFLTKLYSNVITDAAVATCSVVWYSCQFVGFVYFEYSPPVNFHTEYTSCFVIIV